MKRGRARLTRLLLPILAIAGVVAPAAASARQACDALVPRDAIVTSKRWAAPLARTVTVQARGVSLREALARVAAAAGVRLSYSPELLPLERSVCASWDALAAGDVLADLLRGTRLEPVVAGADHVVLAPVRPESSAARTEAAPVIPLEAVRVETRPAGAAEAWPTVAVEVIDGREIAHESAGNLAQALNGRVPGVWLWRSAPGLSARWGSIRGASSFGPSAPKVYIDGIEVANPLLVTRIAAEAIDHIEVIRGPQGGALYGADALSGVTNIVTRHDVAEGGAPRAHVHGRFGVSASDFASGAVLGQEHGIALSAGGGNRSLALDLALGSSGEFVPDAFARHLAVGASGRVIGERGIVTGTLRVSAEQIGNATSPVLPDSLVAVATSSGRVPAADARSVVQYTAGVTARLTEGGRWTHTLVAGFDGFALDGGSADAGAQLVQPAAALLAAGAAALRGTLRWSSTAQLDRGAAGSGALVLTAEHSMLRERGRAQVAASIGSRSSTVSFPAPEGVVIEESRTNTGLAAQTNINAFGRLLLNGALRFEHEGGADGAGQWATLPTVGAAFVSAFGAATVKVRGAYGRAIRWPHAPAAAGYWLRVQDVLCPDLEPEQQAGTELGVDVSIGRAFTLQLTRFDQTASGLMQPVAIEGAGTGFHRAVGPAYASVLQNVGRIDNDGWEAAALLERGRLSLAGTLSLVDSRVRQVVPGYTGDLRPGDRVLAVPALTTSLTAGWRGTGWTGSLTATRAANWVNYDRIALAGVDPAARPVGDALRAYWRAYDGVTHLRAAFTRDLTRGFTLTLVGDNLLDYQLGEPDNLTVLPGRTISLGVRASF